MIALSNRDLVSMIQYIEASHAIISREHHNNTRLSNKARMAANAAAKLRKRLMALSMTK